MMTWGDPASAIIKENIGRQKREDALRESQISLNHSYAESLKHNSDTDGKTVVIHNHFNIIINLSPGTNEEKLISIVERLTSIVKRVN